MAATFRVVKGQVHVDGDGTSRFTAADGETLRRRYARRTSVRLTRTRHEDLDVLTGLPGLAELLLVSARVEDPSALTRIPTLRHLHVNGPRLGAGLDVLADLTQVEEIEVLNTRGPVALPSLERLTALRRLTLWGCRGLTDAAPLLTAPNLTEVRLTDVGIPPDDLEPLVARESVTHVWRFGSPRENARSDEILARYGKTRYPGHDPAAGQADG